MVMKAYSKTVLRSFKSNFGRFVAITVIIFLGIAFVSGLGTLAPTATNSFSEYLTERNVADVIVKSKSTQGFSTQEIENFKNSDYISEMQAFTAIDMEVANLNARIYIAPIANMAVNTLELIEGSFPKNDGQIVVERKSNTMKSYNIGDFFEAFGFKKEIVGIVANPLYYTKQGDDSITNKKPLDIIAYIDSSYFTIKTPITDIYLKITGTEGLNVFEGKYENTVANAVASLEEAYPNNAYLTLKENKSSAIWSGYNTKINVICSIFPIFFIAVATLVVLTTMTRIVEEDRSVIGCYKTLGYANGKILFKYLILAFVCCLVSTALGLFAGVYLLPRAIFPAFVMEFFIPQISTTVNFLPGVISVIAMFIAVLSVTLGISLKELKGEPASILKPKSPKAGKKILLERIPFIWKRLAFRYKSTFRNIFRYVNHFVMTVVSVAGSTALVFAGFALLNVSDGMDSFVLISAVVVLFALALCVFVIYNLTNMNIGERKREIATLKVLGYNEFEVASYIYREIFIMALVGVLFGVPLGCALIEFILKYLEFGSLAQVKWWTYILSGGLVLIFIGVVDLLLFRKIVKIDMTTSLKSVE